MTFYDHLSPWYDLLAEGSEGQLRQRGLDLLALKPGERALEVGTGTGHALLAMADAVGSVGLVCGVDLSRGMLRQANKRILKTGKQSIIKLVQGNGLSLPFGSQAFDAIFLSFTLELLEASERQALLREIQRVLYPNGRLGVVTLSSQEGGKVVALYNWMHNQFPQWLDCRPIPVEQELSDAGWTMLKTVHTQTWGLPVSITISKIH